MIVVIVVVLVVVVVVVPIVVVVVAVSVVLDLTDRLLTKYFVFGTYWIKKMGV